MSHSLLTCWAHTGRIGIYKSILERTRERGRTFGPETHAHARMGRNGITGVDAGDYASQEIYFVTFVLFVFISCFFHCAHLSLVQLVMNVKKTHFVWACRFEFIWTNDYGVTETHRRFIILSGGTSVEKQRQQKYKQNRNVKWDTDSSTTMRLHSHLYSFCTVSDSCI